MKITVNLELESEEDVRKVDNYIKADNLMEVIKIILDEILIDDGKLDKKVKAQSLMDEIRADVIDVLKEYEIKY